MKPTSAASRIRDISLSEIDRTRNHRLAMPGDQERIEGLKQSIEACGQLQPIRVYERSAEQKTGKHDRPYILGFGARRCAAIELLGRKAIRAIIFEPASDAEIAQARAVENLHRQDITPLEEVRAVSDVLEAITADPKFTGNPHEEAATRLARSVVWVRDRDYLHRLTKGVQQFALRSGLPAGHLRELAKVGDPAEQMRLACESAGAPSWCFAADGKPSQQHREVQDRYFAELADGRVNRWPLSRLRAEVGKVQLSLKIIPWEYDKPLHHGSVKLRACAGCPHNSETDPTLFGVEPDKGNPRGFCANPSCYNAKGAAAEAAKEQVLKRIEKRKEQTPEAIRTASPAWLKQSTVVGYVKRKLDKAKRGGTSSRKPQSTGGKRELTPHEQALRSFRKDIEAWQASAFSAVMAGINAQAAHRVSWCVLQGVPVFWDHPRIELPYVNEYGAPTTAEPVVPEASAELAAAVSLAFKGTRSAWVELLAQHEQGNPAERFGDPHPRLLELVARAIGVELPPLPSWVPAAAPAEAQASAA